jgi:hypothetical protein
VIDASAAPSSPPDDDFAQKLRAFGPVGVAAALIVTAFGALFEPFGALLAVLWIRRSRTPWRALGLASPKSWIATAATGIVFGALFKIGMKMIVMPLLGAEPINQAYHYLAGNRAALPEMLFDVVLGAGFGEELVYRGFLFERLRRLLGNERGTTIAIVLLTAALFGAIHYPGQGLAGAEQATVVGLVFGTIFAMTGRLWMLMFAHAAFDVTAVFMIYWNLESWVAHLIFR